MLILTAVLLAVSVSTDIFVTFFTYGARGIRVPPRSVAVLISVTAGAVFVSGILGTAAASAVPDMLLRGIGFAILLIIGIIRLFDSLVRRVIRRGIRRDMRFRAMGMSFLLQVYADPVTADVDEGGVLSVGEALPLAFAMSVDGTAAGFASSPNLLTALTLTVSSALFGMLAVFGGRMLGAYIKGRCPADLSPIGGIILILLAVSRLAIK